MFEVRMPREIKAYKEKIALGMTTRQLICNGLALAICVPTYMYGRAYIDEDPLIWTIFIIAGAFGFVGYYTKNGLTAEQYAMTIFNHSFRTPQKRKFVTEKAIDRVERMDYEDVKGRLEKLSKKEEK